MVSLFAHRWLAVARNAATPQAAETIEETTQKVKRLHIGTHSKQIEVGLRDVLRKHHWECLADYAGGSTNQTPWGPVSFGDGVQSWLNPRFA